MEPDFTCCLCGERIAGWGNNPAPLMDDTMASRKRCCDDCNATKVIPARIERFRHGHN